MMGLDDFGLSVLAGWLANRLDFLKPKSATAAESTQDVGLKTREEPPEGVDDASPPRKFKAFDAWTDLDNLLKVVKAPLISILIEDRPSTHYRLPSLVLESRVTGEWYVFYRGRMSFEGTGGGIMNSEAILDRLKAANVAVGVWVLDQALLDRLDNGYELWPTIRSQAIPFLAAPGTDYSWSEIKRNVLKLTDSTSAS